jgi:hypothetical protein
LESRILGACVLYSYRNCSSQGTIDIQSPSREVAVDKRVGNPRRSTVDVELVRGGFGVACILPDKDVVVSGSSILTGARTYGDVVGTEHIKPGPLTDKSVTVGGREVEP